MGRVVLPVGECLQVLSDIRPRIDRLLCLISSDMRPDVRHAMDELDNAYYLLLESLERETA